MKVDFPIGSLLDKDTLKLIKVLRTEGYTVIVKPDNGQPTQISF